MEPEERRANIRKPRGRYAKGVARRNQILEVALDVFATLGEKGALIKEIADRMGMSQAGVLHYFGSREGLLIWVLAERDRVAAEKISRDRFDDPLTPMADTLRRNGDVPGLIRLYVSLAAAAGFPEHPAREFFEIRSADIVAGLRDGLADLQRQGRVRPDIDSAAVARLALAAADGIQYQWLIDPTVDMGGVIDTILALVVNVPQPSATSTGGAGEAAQHR
ncbi:TetR/AcrR family transcriptional regulator [Embleya scabrispora]|uniref:TetR/AcrR family transcriptional regulator n=1 Tax=Embleya scabrispora TaxID=159449 RepID=UPI00038244B2|nr:TetR/AcrR family transcriptional regulator [Embleya scabrispora]MYS84707.1 TetR family transcriptional regulator [Streptomyces sp. SID5474]